MEKISIYIRFTLAIPFIIMLNIAFIFAFIGIYICTLLETLSHKEAWEETKTVAIKAHS